MEQGADFVEQDLAVTKDGVLVCIHDLTLERTTDVEEVFPDRFVEVKEGPMPGKHWLVNDFTLAEIKRLDVGSWFDKKFAGDAHAHVPGSDRSRPRQGRGCYPELKDPEFYRTARHQPRRSCSRTSSGRTRSEADPKTPLILQSFDERRWERGRQGHCPRCRACSSWRRRTRAARFRREGARDRDVGDRAWGRTSRSSRSGRSWSRGPTRPALTVTPWTFRSKRHGRSPSVRDEMAQFLYKLGVDALFTDNPDMFPRQP